MASSTTNVVGKTTSVVAHFRSHFPIFLFSSCVSSFPSVDHCLSDSILTLKIMNNTNVSPNCFIGFPSNSFTVEDRRSLTVLIDDYGMYDVFSGSVKAGRYDKFSEAMDVADGLNRIWKSLPYATAEEVLSFVSHSQKRLLGSFSV